LILKDKLLRSFKKHIININMEKDDVKKSIKCYICPICKSKKYTYDCYLNRICVNCGYVDSGSFT
jgi:hypothetical protein